MGECIVAKFEHYTQLNDEERKLLNQLEEEKKSFKAGEVIEKCGKEADYLYTIFDGWAYISSTVDTDIRSIFDVRIEADFVGLSELSFEKNLYDFIALTDVTVCPFPQKHLDAILTKSANLRNVMFNILSREQAIMYERIISLSRRTALEKVAHFICEISLRLGMVGKSLDTEFNFPLRQNYIADMLGLSSVHVSRSMNILKKNGYIDYNRSTMTIKNKQKLLNLAHFKESFLLCPQSKVICD